jgi:hypothetical protein
MSHKDEQEKITLVSEDNEKLLHLSTLLKTSYTAKKKLYIPWYNLNPKDDIFFIKAAKLCNKLGADPVHFIDAQFNGISQIDKYFPAYLSTIEAEQKYILYMAESNIEETKIDLETLYRIQLNYLVTYINKTGLSVENILMKDYIDFTPWFRILITKEPVPEIIDKYRPKIFPLDSTLLEFLENKKIFDLNRLI